MFLDFSMKGKKFMGCWALWRNISGAPASQTTEILKSLDMDTEIPTEKTDMFSIQGLFGSFFNQQNPNYLKWKLLTIKLHVEAQICQVSTFVLEVLAEHATSPSETRRHRSFRSARHSRRNSHKKNTIFLDGPLSFDLRAELTFVQGRSVSLYTLLALLYGFILQLPL